MLAGSLQAAMPHTIELDTRQQDVPNWTVWEVSGGQLISAAPVYAGISWGQVQALTIPFSDNDGFWYADIPFTLPAGAQNIVLHIHRLGADDRAVVQLNGNDVTSSGTDNSGAGEMTFTDGGPNQPYTFLYISGPESIKYRSNFVIGQNDLRIYVNNTGQGVTGVPVPPSQGNPTAIGIYAAVTYQTR